METDPPPTDNVELKRDPESDTSCKVTAGVFPTPSPSFGATQTPSVDFNDYPAEDVEAPIRSAAERAKGILDSQNPVDVEHFFNPEEVKRAFPSKALPNFSSSRSGACEPNKRAQRVRQEPSSDAPTPQQQRILQQAIALFAPGTIERIECDDLPKFRLQGLKAELPVYQFLTVAMMRILDQHAGGGILAHEMGLGKTISTIANLLENQRREKDPYAQPQKPSLVVCPKIIAPQWCGELRKHLEDKALGHVVAHFGKATLRGVNAELAFNSSCVIVTTYPTVLKSWEVFQRPQSERKEGSSVLHETHFSTIVLDEATKIKNPDSQTSNSCRSLKKDFGWVLSGTPVENSIMDLFPYLDFIPQLKGTHTAAEFKSAYAKDQHGRAKLKGILKVVMLRLTHESLAFGRRLLNLPEGVVNWVPVKMLNNERELFTMITDIIRGGLTNQPTDAEAACKRQGTMTRLRKLSTAWIFLVNHIHLVFSHVGGVQLFEQVLYETMERRLAKQTILNIQRAVKRVAKKPSKDETISQSPVERLQSILRSYKHNPTRDVAKHLPMSSKLIAVMEKLTELHEKGEGKCVVFMQFLDGMRILKQSCKAKTWRFVTICGSMSSEDRESALSKFRDNDQTNILIASSSCATEGLNLGFASHALFVDVAFNAARQDQAFGRIYRPGQENCAHFWVFYTVGSYDESLRELQNKKTATNEDLMEAARDFMAQECRNSASNAEAFQRATQSHSRIAEAKSSKRAAHNAEERPRKRPKRQKQATARKPRKRPQPKRGPKFSDDSDDELPSAASSDSEEEQEIGADDDEYQDE